MPTTILCIDDESNGLLIRKKMLEASGHRVLTASCGQEGLALLASFSVDLVILDYRMPEMDGAKVAHLIRQSRPNLPIIMLSGFPEEIPGDTVLIVNALVTKGDSPRHLLRSVDTALTSQRIGVRTILNVDDNVAHRYAISRILKDAGFRVVEAGTGAEALSAALAKPSIILLDINLPDMLGFEVCKRLKEDPRTQDIPVIHVSATCPGELAARESVASGAESFVGFASGTEELLQLVRKSVA